MHNAERLVYIRTVLERIKPIDQKLKYQIDKVLPLQSTMLTMCCSLLKQLHLTLPLRLPKMTH